MDRYFTIYQGKLAPLKNSPIDNHHCTSLIHALEGIRSMRQHDGFHNLRACLQFWKFQFIWIFKMFVVKHYFTLKSNTSAFEEWVPLGMHRELSHLQSPLHQISPWPWGHSEQDLAVCLPQLTLETDKDFMQIKKLLLKTLLPYKAINLILRKKPIKNYLFVLVLDMG